MSGKGLLRADLAQGSMDAETADLLFGLGRAWAATHQVREALANLDCAFEYYAHAGDVERMVALAGHPYIGSLTQQMTQLRRRAVSLVPSDSPHAGRLSAVYGLSLGMVGDYEGANVAFSQALAIAQREGSADLQLLTRANMAHVDGFHLRWQESLENSLQAIKLAAQADDLPSRLYAHFWAGTSLLDFGRPEEAQQHADAMLALLEKLRDRVWLARAYLLAYRLSHLTGDFKAARNFSERLQVMDPGYSLFWLAEYRWNTKRAISTRAISTSKNFGFHALGPDQVSRERFSCYGDSYGAPYHRQHGPIRCCRKNGSGRPLLAFGYSRSLPRQRGWGWLCSRCNWVMLPRQRSSTPIFQRLEAE